MARKTKFWQEVREPTPSVVHGHGPEHGFEREVREKRRTDGIPRKASANFAHAELDRRPR